MSPGGRQVLQRTRSRSIQGPRLQVLINPDLSVEGQAALAQRVCDEALRRGFRPRDEFSCVMVHPNPDDQTSDPTNMKLSIDSDPNMVAVKSKYEYPRKFGYVFHVGVSRIGVAENMVRLTFETSTDLELAIRVGLPCKAGFLAEYYEKLLAGVEDLSPELTILDDSIDGLIILKSARVSVMHVRVQTGLLSMIPLWAAHKRHLDESRLIPLDR